MSIGELTVRDVRMLKKGIEQRWDISKEWRDAAVRKLITVIVSSTSSERAVISAVKALASLDALNQKDEHANAIQSDRNRFLEIAARLNGGSDTEGIAEVGANRSIEIIDGTAEKRS